jgi:hypothetical protein
MALEGIVFWGFVAAFAAWVFAEFRDSRATRIALGVASIILLAVFTPTIKQWEVFDHVQCMRLIDRELQAGNVPAVRSAVRAYMDTYGSEGSKAAVSSFRQALDEAMPPNSR